jgi:hypothetical protein
VRLSPERKPPSITVPEICVWLGRHPERGYKMLKVTMI